MKVVVSLFEVFGSVKMEKMVISTQFCISTIQSAKSDVFLVYYLLNRSIKIKKKVYITI